VVTGQIPSNPRVHRAEGQLAVFRPSLEAVIAVEQPTDFRTRKVGSKGQAGPVPKPVCTLLAAETSAEVGCPYVLPNDGVSNRPPGLSRPEERRLSLVGQADGCEIGRCRVDLNKRLSDHPANVSANLIGIVLDPTRPRVDLLVLSLRHSDDLAVVIDESAS
jgi:hypothetical protein